MHHCNNHETKKGTQTSVASSRFHEISSNPVWSPRRFAKVTGELQLSMFYASKFPHTTYFISSQYLAFQNLEISLWAGIIRLVSSVLTFSKFDTCRLCPTDSQKTKLHEDVEICKNLQTVRIYKPQPWPSPSNDVVEHEVTLTMNKWEATLICTNHGNMTFYLAHGL